MGARIHKMKNIGAGSARPYTSTNVITIRAVSGVWFWAGRPCPYNNKKKNNTMTKPRGIRNNNPLNIRHGKDQWLGAAATQTDNAFVQFQSMTYGYRAAWRTLQTYYKRLKERKKLFTVENILHRWAPPKENDTKEYIRTVLSLSSIGGNERLLPPQNVTGYHRLSALIAAMTVVECGIRPTQVDTEAIYQGYKLAFPKKAQELDEWLVEEDEYGDW